MPANDSWEPDDKLDAEVEDAELKTDDGDDFELEIVDFDDDEDEDGEGEEDDEDEVSGNVIEPDAIESLTSFVAFMVGNLVDDPDTVTIQPEQFGQNVHIKIIVPEDEMGRVIGRQGRIARSMRTLVTIAASRKGLRASLDIDS
ncbi:MAG TPA: KH domain-containing protein [Thermomicrobiales bacterium]|nr:KH domain-containing protein [Thermomicrobiales bacterium]